jgi:hypothetical protein
MFSVQDQQGQSFPFGLPIIYVTNYYIHLLHNAALICRTTTAFYLRKPPILYEEPTAREPRVFANADGHDLARCYGPDFLFVDSIFMAFYRLGERRFPPASCFLF